METSASFEARSAPSPYPTSPESTGDPSFQSRWSLIDWPSISLPSGISSDGLPFAVQLVARRLDEVTLLRAARRVEEALGFSGRPPD